MTINLLHFYEDIAVMRSYTILEITTLISSYEVTIERRYADIRCTAGGMCYGGIKPRFNKTLLLTLNTAA
jgi:hypothetical protein